MTGYEYVNQQISIGRWDLDADTFRIEEALADAYEDGKYDANLENGKF